MKLANKHYTIILIGIFIDQITKVWAELSLSMSKPIVLIPHVLEFVLVHNYGAAYGIFEGQRLFLSILSVSIVIAAFCAQKWIISSWITAWGLSFIFIGALGNIIDRYRDGYVIDFINIHIFPVFNVADICIDIGIALFIYELYISSRPRVKVDKNLPGRL